MPQPTQRCAALLPVKELLHDPEERSAEKESKPHRDGKSQRELQREELERLLSDGGPPTEEQRKKDRIRSLEAKIAEMQAELEAERSSERAKSDVRQKRDQHPSCRYFGEAIREAKAAEEQSPKARLSTGLGEFHAP
ncbi:Catsper1 [Symbiodinium sp. KB8]|nr:Catsper1 [Symbiodinium sp. KB8]